MLIKCKVCESKISQSAKFCPYCGHKNMSPAGKFIALVLIVLGSVALVESLFKSWF